MSWAAHNPEAYDEILKTGIVNKLTTQLTKNGFEDMDPDTIAAMVEVMAEDSKVYDALIWWARKETTAAAVDYFASIADSRE